MEKACTPALYCGGGLSCLFSGFWYLFPTYTLNPIGISHSRRESNLTTEHLSLWKRKRPFHNHLSCQQEMSLYYSSDDFKRNKFDLHESHWAVVLLNFSGLFMRRFERFCSMCSFLSGWHLERLSIQYSELCLLLLVKWYNQHFFFIKIWLYIGK